MNQTKKKGRLNTSVHAVFKINLPKFNFSNTDQQQCFLNEAFNSQVLDNDLDPKQLCNNIIQQKKLDQI